MNTKGGLTERKTEIQQGGAKTTMQGLIKAMEPQIRKALPSVITPERFTRMVLTALSSTPKLQTCTPQSFLGAMMQAAHQTFSPKSWMTLGFSFFYLTHIKFITSANTFTKSKNAIPQRMTGWHFLMQCDWLHHLLR